jgi:hypothetical protein
VTTGPLVTRMVEVEPSLNHLFRELGRRGTSETVRMPLSHFTVTLDFATRTARVEESVDPDGHEVVGFDELQAALVRWPDSD